MRLATAVAAALLCPIAATHAEQTVVPAPRSCIDYRDVTTAVLVSLRVSVIQSRETKTEWGGIVYGIDGKVCATLPATSGHARMTNFRFMLPREARVLALFHTHPPGEAVPDYFSRADVVGACALNVPSFMATMDGDVYVFTPSPSKCRRDQGPLVSGRKVEGGAS